MDHTIENLSLGFCRWVENMMQGVQRGLRPILPYFIERPLTRVELHVHLDGMVRHETIYELSREKSIPLPGDGTFEALRRYLIQTKGVSLAKFLEPFDTILAPFIDDVSNIERMAYEAVQDSRAQGVAYFEARFCPHLLISDKILNDIPDCRNWVYDVTRAAIRGLELAQNKFGTKGTLIIACIRGRPQHWYKQSLEVAADSNFHRGWIVGVDVAGCADTPAETSDDEIVRFVREAARLGIPRTIHAGETGPGRMVTHAVDVLLANRIGHGYRLTDDQAAYHRIRQDRVHLETCPWSSLLTASVPMSQVPHPIVRFFQDDFNISINTDDPTLTGSQLDDEYALLRAWGLQEHHFVKATFNAARSCFLPENEKSELIHRIANTFGFYDKGD